METEVKTEPIWHNPDNLTPDRNLPMSTPIDDGGPALPTWECNGMGIPEPSGVGMSLRDYFAVHAPIDGETGSTWDDHAKTRYEYADAMLKARAGK